MEEALRVKTEELLKIFSQMKKPEPKIITKVVVQKPEKSANTDAEKENGIVRQDNVNVVGDGDSDKVTFRYDKQGKYNFMKSFGETGLKKVVLSRKDLTHIMMDGVYGYLRDVELNQETENSVNMSKKLGRMAQAKGSWVMKYGFACLVGILLSLIH